MMSNVANADATAVNPAELSIRPDLIRQLVPPHCEAELLSRSIDLDNFVPIPLEQLKISLD
jgi:glycogen synthase kinase 3 beta